MRVNTFARQARNSTPGHLLKKNENTCPERGRDPDIHSSFTHSSQTLDSNAHQQVRQTSCGVLHSKPLSNDREPATHDTQTLENLNSLLSHTEDNFLRSLRTSKPSPCDINHNTGRQGGGLDKREHREPLGVFPVLTGLVGTGLYSAAQTRCTLKKIQGFYYVIFIVNSEYAY